MREDAYRHADEVTVVWSDIPHPAGIEAVGITTSVPHALRGLMATRTVDTEQRSIPVGVIS